MESDHWKEFEDTPLTHSAAHHLFAVMNLKKERGYARVTDVAKYLAITTGSASTNLKVLKSKKLVVEDDNRFLLLSPYGEALAKAVLARREVFQKFLSDIVGVSPEQAERDACKTEHLLSQETSQKLMDFMQKALMRRANSSSSPKGTPTFNCKTEHCGSKVSSDECPVCDDHCLYEELVNVPKRKN